LRKRIHIPLPQETLIQKTQPALIVQPDIANRHSPITIVAAITSQFDEPLGPTEALIQSPEGGLPIPSVALLNQIRSIDKRRLVRWLDVITPPIVTREFTAEDVRQGIATLQRRIEEVKASDADQVASKDRRVANAERNIQTTALEIFR
jgi:mRNA interferase MazF